jgi:hypothetical protein
MNIVKLVDATRHDRSDSSGFANYQSADCLVVIGLESQLTDQQTKSLSNANAGRHNVRIAGFDWLLKRAAAIVENVSSGEVDVIKRHRVV